MGKKTITPVDVIKKIIIIMVVIVDAYPIFWLFTCAFKKSSEFVTKPSFALPDGFYLKNFVKHGQEEIWGCTLKTV